MFLKTWMKKCISALITTMLIIAPGVSAFAAPSGGNAAKLVFSGITMHNNGDSVQGFLDVKVRNIENNGITFTLEYNTDYVQLSDAENNSEEAITGGEFFSYSKDTVPGFFKFNETVIDGDTTYIDGNLEKANGKYGEIEFAIYLKEDAETGRYIGVKDPQVEGLPPTKVILASDTELTLGGLSFNIKNPADFAKLTSAELSKVFRVKETGDGASVFEISYVDVTTYPHFMFYDQSQYLGYEFEVVNPIESVKLNNPSMTVTAAEIFNSDSVLDIIRWLNLYMNDVTVSYADGTQFADTIVWDPSAEGYSFSGIYDVKGGEYTITQKYNDDFTVSAMLTVDHVSVKGYYADDEFDPVNYSTEGVPPDISDGLMRFPQKVYPIFDKTISGAGNYSVSVNDDWHITSAPMTESGSSSDFFNDKTDGKYIFSASPVTSELPRWATFDTDTEVDVTRGINMNVTPEPGTGETDPAHPEKGDTGIIAVVNDDGVMTITVSNVGDILPLPDTMNFILRMPNGEIIDPDVVIGAGGRFDVTLNNPNDGSAVMIIEPGTDDASTGGSQLRLAQYINLGSRGGMFALAAQNGDDLRSRFTLFAPDPRNNYYTGNEAGSNYTFDYSGVKSSLLSFDASMSAPPTTLTLAAGDKINTTYSGEDGTMPGTLSVIKVTNWIISSGNTVTPGAVVTFTGTLADTIYTNYGMVTNPNGIEVTLRVEVSEAPPEDEEEKIADIKDFVFSKRQSGYTVSDIAAQQFTIENIGNVDIRGISINIDSDNFIVSGKPPYLLNQGASSNFTIIPKTGLAVGEYTATVTIGSNKNSSLDTFTVKFVVTDGVVYNIVITPTPDEGGTASAAEGYAYEPGETVNINAAANEDYEFVNWSVVNGDINDISFLPSANATAASFTMPDMSLYTSDTLELNAVFAETGMAKLRLTDLKELENDNDNTENNLLDNNFRKIAFNDKTTEYYVVTGSTSAENKAYFKLKDPDVDVEVTIATKAGITDTPGAEIPLTATERSDDEGAYDTEVFTLESVPTVQVLTVKLTSGEYTRSYTLNIFRKKESNELIEFGYGNSPYGLIMRDDNITDKNDAKEQFVENGNKFAGPEMTPEGGHEGLLYNTDAWGTSREAYNYDRDDTALFVYSGDTFKDPGIRSITDSLGRTISIGDVKRQVKLQRLTAENPSSLMADLREITEITEILGDDFDAEETMMRDYRIRPGVYTIEYSFNDFDRSTVTVGRPLIVLYGRGDVNLDGKITEEDALIIENRFRAMIPYGNLHGYESGSMLCLYRICDANANRNINIGDANYIRKYISDMTEFYK